MGLSILSPTLPLLQSLPIGSRPDGLLRTDPLQKLGLGQLSRPDLNPCQGLEGLGFGVGGAGFCR